MPQTARIWKSTFSPEIFCAISWIAALSSILLEDYLADGAGYRTAVSAIAFDLGFGDPSYFNRTFKKRFGITPRETRARSIALVNASDVKD